MSKASVLSGASAGAVLGGSLNLPDANRLTGKLAVAGKTFDVKMEPEFAFDIPLKDIPNGKHEITLDVCKGPEKLASGTTPLVKQEFKAGATQIDRQQRCLVVDGQPYLAITPFFGVERGIKTEQQEMVLKNMVRLHKDMGYKCFLVGGPVRVRDPIGRRTLCPGGGTDRGGYRRDPRAGTEAAVRGALRLGPPAHRQSLQRCGPARPNLPSR